MENKVKFEEFTGQSYKTRSLRFDNSKTINLYIEEDKTGQSKDKSRFVLLGTPGLNLKATIGTGPIRALYVPSTRSDVLYVVSGNEVYICNPDFTTIIKLTGNLLTSTGLVSIADNGTHVMIVDGIYGYTTLLVSSTLEKIGDIHFYPADTVTFQDGYFILNQTGTAYFFTSDLYAITFPELNTANKSGAPDDIKTLISNGRQLYLFGENTIEVWWNSGGVSLIPGTQAGITPFTRQDGRYIHFGCQAIKTLQRVNNTLVWLGRNSAGHGTLFIMENEQPVRISTHAQEIDIQNSTNPNACTAWVAQIEGHYFYVLNIPGVKTTWMYDLTTQMWTELQTNTNGSINRHRAEVHALFVNNHIVGDFENGKVYHWDLNTFTDNGSAIQRLRQMPHISKTGYRLFYSLFELDAEIANNTNNELDVVLQISNDGGNTWGSELIAKTGKIGNYTTRLRWHRLGSARDRMFRIYTNTGNLVAFLNTYLSIEQGHG